MKRVHERLTDEKVAEISGMTVEQVRQMKTPEAQARRFGVTVEQIRAGYLRSAAQLEEMAVDCEKAAAAGKRKFCGYPATPEQAADFRAQAAEFRAK